MSEICPEQMLANAIVEQAAADYRRAAKKFHKNKGIVEERTNYLHAQAVISEMAGVTPKERYHARRHEERTARYIDKHEYKAGVATDVINECTRFFKSAWYKALTSVDGDYLLSKLREECGIVS